MKHRILHGINLAAVLFLFNSCYMHSNMQNARMIPKKKHELTGSFGRSYYRFESTDADMEPYTNNVTVMYGYGAGKRVNVRTSYSRYFYVGEEGEGFNRVTFEPKISLKQNICAISIPLGTDFAAGDVELEVYPTLFLTLPVNNYFEFNSTTKLGYYFGETGIRLSTYLGPSLSHNLEKFAVMPEVGWQFYSEDDLTNFIWGIGFRFTI